MNSARSLRCSTQATRRAEPSKTVRAPSAGFTVCAFANAAANFVACSQNVFGAITEGRVCARHSREYVRKEYADDGAVSDEVAKREVTV